MCSLFNPLESLKCCFPLKSQVTRAVTSVNCLPRGRVIHISNFPDVSQLVNYKNEQGTRPLNSLKFRELLIYSTTFHWSICYSLKCLVRVQTVDWRELPISGLITMMDSNFLGSLTPRCYSKTDGSLSRSTCPLRDTHALLPGTIILLTGSSKTEPL